MRLEAKIGRGALVLLALLAAPAVVLAQSDRCQQWQGLTQPDITSSISKALRESGCTYTWKRAASGVYHLSVTKPPQEPEESPWAGLREAYNASKESAAAGECEQSALPDICRYFERKAFEEAYAAWAEANPEKAAQAYAEIAKMNAEADAEAVAERERRRQTQEWLASQAQALAAVEEARQQREAQEAARKAAADAQLQQHMQQIAERKSQEWQNQLWLWEAQRQSQAQQQYQQQLLQQLRYEQVQRQWFRRDLVRAFEGIPSAPANCWYSYVQHRYVCY